MLVPWVTTEKVEELILREEVFDEGNKHRQKVYQRVEENVLKSQERIRKRKLEKGFENNFKGGRSCPQTKHPTTTEERRKNGERHAGSI